MPAVPYSVTHPDVFSPMRSGVLGTMKFTLGPSTIRPWADGPFIVSAPLVANYFIVDILLTTTTEAAAVQVDFGYCSFAKTEKDPMGTCTPHYIASDTTDGVNGGFFLIFMMFPRSEFYTFSISCPDAGTSGSLRAIGSWNISAAV
jgi:hypothetical protein